MSGAIDSDYAWLKSHLSSSSQIESRNRLVSRIATFIENRVSQGRLPYTLGLFGGWGTGKTTFLAMLAEELEPAAAYRIVYFNSWKYAGFMEIVPALIYKILQYGVEGEELERSEAARRVVLALGKKYSDQVGEWAQTKIGVNPVELFKDLYDLPGTIQTNVQRGPEAVRAYYTQVDKAQDELRKALGTVTPGIAPHRAIVVLIDELDRCDPDEAFDVIKQMRVLFGMRDLPVIFVVAANPDPIGLAIKHRYGLESDSGDYEARRILEKFVDSYEDLSTPEPLGNLVRGLWQKQNLPWIAKLDEANITPPFAEDDIKNASAFDVITTGNTLFSNIRVLQKSFEYVLNNSQVNRHLRWTKWFLEIANQIDPRFRRDLRILASPLRKCVFLSYLSLHQIRYRVNRNGKRLSVEYATDKGNTAFSIFRSLFWDQLKNIHGELDSSSDPEDKERALASGRLFAEARRVDTVVLLSLLPFGTAGSFQELCGAEGESTLPDLSDKLDPVVDEFASELA
jgi:hypothetical protein